MKLLISIFITSMLFTIVSAQNTPIEKLTEALKNGASDFPKSKVFIKTDKDIYAPGEKIWFKAEAINCLTEKASSESELVIMVKAESGEVIVDHKFLVINGKVNNQITLPPWSPEGNAFLIAYTPKALVVNEASLAAIKPITVNLLRNNDYVLNFQLDNSIYKPSDDVKLSFQLKAITPSNKKERMIISMYDYQQEIFTEKVTVTVNEWVEFKYKLPNQVEDGLYFEIQTVGKTRITQKIPVPTSADRIYVEFYPEGGKLLTNNIQRIVYRAIDPFGNPADVSGNVYDQMNNQAGVGKILKPGLGLISLMPAPGQTYVFKIDSKQGNGQKFEMPDAILDGSAFTLVKTEKDNIKANINNTGKLIGQNITIAAISGGEIYLSYELKAQQKNSLQIANKDLPIGLINFVVLDSLGKIVSERMIFNTPNEDIDIAIETHMKPSETNGEVEIIINAQSFINQFGKSTIDVKVVDAQNLYRNSSGSNYNFLKYPLLTSTPQTVLDIYITNIELIANTYRYFGLQHIVDGKNYLEQKGAGKFFSGTVTDKNNVQIPNATVMVVHANNPSIASTITDENGRFVFPILNKSKDMVVKAISENGKKTYSVQLDHSFDETLEEILMMESFKVKTVYSTDDTPEYFELNSNLLKLAGSETKVKKPREMSNSEKMLQSGSSILDVIRMIKPFTLKGNQIVFYGSTNSFLNQQGALIVIDGQKMGTSIDALNTVNPHEVSSINISTEPIDIQQYTALNSVGIIEIRTHGGMNSLRSLNEKESLPMSEFQQENFSENVWKHQTTLLWQPNASLDENGKLKLKLKLSELRTNVVVQVDITSANGITHQQSAIFSTVDKK